MLRIVVRNGFTHDLADLLLADLARVLPDLEKEGGHPKDLAKATAFHH